MCAWGGLGVVLLESLLLMARGGLLPHLFIRPPRNMGTYLMSHCLNAGEFYSESCQ